MKKSHKISTYRNKIQNESFFLLSERCQSLFEGEEQTRIRALLKDVPRGMTWKEIRDSKKAKIKNTWENLRVEIENFMVSISLFLLKTMIDD